MKKILVLLALMFAMLVSTGTVLAEVLTSDQIEIKALINKMYAIDPDTFEYATFGAKYTNGERTVKGKYDPDRQCLLFGEFLVKEAIIKNKRVNQGCLTNYFRYPAVSDMELSPDTRTSPLPKAHINTPVVNGENAKVYVNLENAGNVMYYLKKLSVGWRIYRVESSENDATIDTMRQGDVVKVFPPEK